MPTRRYEGSNPLCGDRITLMLGVKDGVVDRVGFTGRGCAISQASASLLTDEIKGKPLKDVVRTERELEATLRRSPTTSEIAAALGVSIEAVREARAAAHARSPELLEQPVSSGQPEGRRRIDRFQIEEAGFSAAEDAATLARLLPHLEDREREALRLRFEEDLTQTEIGMRIGCSQMHVSRLIRGAVARLTAVHEAQSQSRSAPVPGVKSAA